MGLWIRTSCLVVKRITMLIKYAFFAHEEEIQDTTDRLFSTPAMTTTSSAPSSAANLPSVADQTATSPPCTPAAKTTS